MKFDKFDAGYAALMLFMIFTAHLASPPMYIHPLTCVVWWAITLQLSADWYRGRFKPKKPKAMIYYDKWRNAEKKLFQQKKLNEQLFAALVGTAFDKYIIERMEAFTK